MVDFKLTPHLTNKKPKSNLREYRFIGPGDNNPSQAESARKTQATYPTATCPQLLTSHVYPLFLEILQTTFLAVL